MSDRHRDNVTAHAMQRHTVQVPRPQRQRDSTVRSRPPTTQHDTVVITRRPPPRLRGVLTAGAVTSGWNALVVFLPILIAIIAAWWVAGQPSDIPTVIRIAGISWLFGHGNPITIAGLDIGLTPILITAIVLWRLNKAGAHTIRAIHGRTYPSVRAATLSVLISYTSITTLVALAVNQTPFTIDVWRVSLTSAVLVLIGASFGALVESGRGDYFWYGLPLWLRRGLSTGILNVTLVLAAGALLSGVALALRGDSVLDTVRAYPDGEIAVGILALLYVPTAAGWGASYLLGPGFAIGVGTNVTIIDATTGPMPVFPLFASVPEGPLGQWGTLLYGVPILIASIYGIRLGLRSLDMNTRQVYASIMVAGFTAGFVSCVVMYLCSGGIGEHRMAAIGPNPLLSAAAAAAITLVFVLVGCFAVRLSGPRRARGPQEERVVDDG